MGLSGDIKLFFWLMVIVLCSVMVGYLLATVFSVPNQSFAYNEYSERFVDGVYFPQGAFCVHLNKPNTAELEGTIGHETLHRLVDDDYEHFCGDDKVD